MTSPLEQAPQQTELLESLDPTFLKQEAALVASKYQEHIDGVAAKVRQDREPSHGYWESYAKVYGENLDARLEDDIQYYDSRARQKAPEQRDSFDKFVLGVSGNAPEDVRAPEGTSLTPYGYYMNTGKRLAGALQNGQMPEGFEDPALLTKAADFLLARGLKGMLASPDKANPDLAAAITILREATEHVPDFDPHYAGKGLLIDASITCEGILKAESGHWSQVPHAGRAQVHAMLRTATEIQAIQNIRRGYTLLEQRDTSAQESTSEQESPQHEAAEAAWPTKEPDESGPRLPVKTSLTENVPEQELKDEATTQARQSVDDAFESGSAGQLPPEGNTEASWSRDGEDYVDPSGRHWRTPPRAQNVPNEARERILPMEEPSHPNYRTPDGWQDEFDPEPQIGGSKLDQLLLKGFNWGRKWMRAGPTPGIDAMPDDRISNKLAKLRPKPKTTTPLTAEELDARDQQEYDRIDALLADGHAVAYDANGDPVADRPPQPRPSRRARRQAGRQAARVGQQGQPPIHERSVPQTAGEARLEQLRAWRVDLDERVNRLNDHLAHNEQDLAYQEIQNMQSYNLMRLPVDTMMNLTGRARELWEVRSVDVAGGHILPPPPEILYTDAGRQAYMKKFPGRRRRLPWEK